MRASPTEVDQLKNGRLLPKNSRLLPFRPFWDKDLSVLRVGGRLSNSELSFSQSHPVILESRHPVTKLVIQAEHMRLMHAGPYTRASLSESTFSYCRCSKCHSVCDKAMHHVPAACGEASRSTVGTTPR